MKRSTATEIETEILKSDASAAPKDERTIRFDDGRPQPAYRQQEDVIDLKLLFGELLSRWWVLLIALIVGAAITGAYTFFFVTPQYQSTSKIYVYSKTTSITSITDLQIGTQLTSDFTIIAKTREVIDEVIDELSLDISYEDLVKEITINNPSESRILEIVVTDPDAEKAKDIANCMANVLRERIGEVTNTDAPSVVEKAVASQERYSPSYSKNCAIGGIVLLLIVAIILSIIYLNDDTIKTDEDVKKYLGLNVLAMIPVNKNEQVVDRSKSKRR